MKKMCITFHSEKDLFFTVIAGRINILALYQTDNMFVFLVV